MLVPSHPHFLLAVPHASLWHTVSFAQVTTKKPAHNGQQDSLWTSNANNVKKRRLFPPQCSGKSHVSRLENLRGTPSWMPCSTHFSLPLSHCCTDDWFGWLLGSPAGVPQCICVFQTHSWLMKDEKKGGVPVADQLRPPSRTIIPFDFTPILVSSNWIHSTPLPPSTSCPQCNN